MTVIGKAHKACHAAGATLSPSRMQSYALEHTHPPGGDTGVQKGHILTYFAPCCTRVSGSRGSSLHSASGPHALHSRGSRVHPSLLLPPLLSTASLASHVRLVISFKSAAVSELECIPPGRQVLFV